ncbi:MAG TPA: hypothetical protein VFH54_12440 [Mycobacteriales bacterium]|nr:hypothetical protein [Mycobacteriales bacterium]
MSIRGPRLRALVAGQDHVVSRDQLLAGGLTRHAIENCFEYDGWQRLLPQVYLTHAGEASRRQLLVAAQLYVGDDAAIDADDAAFFHGSRVVRPDDATVHVAASQMSPARSHGFVRVRRTSAPLLVVQTQTLRYVDAPTALIAAARRRTSDRAVLAILSDAVQRRLVTVDALVRAHIQGSPRNAAPTDRALAELGAGTRSVSEVDFRGLATASLVLPPLLYNCLLRLPTGRMVSPDALAVDAGLVHETNGRRAHARQDLFEDMQERHDEMTESGLIVMHNTPRRISLQGRAVITQFERVYIRNAGRGLPPGVEVVRIAA